MTSIEFITLKLLVQSKPKNMYHSPGFENTFTK